MERCNEGRNFSNSEKQDMDCCQTNWSEMGVSRKEGQHGKSGEVQRKVGSERICSKEGIDFGEVFSLVPRMESIRILIAIAAQEKWELHHLDVKTAFLNGEIDETRPRGHRFHMVSCQKKSKLTNLMKISRIEGYNGK